MKITFHQLIEFQSPAVTILRCDLIDVSMSYVILHLDVYVPIATWKYIALLGNLKQIQTEIEILSKEHIGCIKLVAYI